MAHQAVRNKRRGHRAEIEAASKINEAWPKAFHMQRTGLDGGHDLRGEHAIGEVKAVKAGPAWLQSMLEQMDRCQDNRLRVGLVKLSRGPGKPVRWLVVQDFDDFTDLLDRAYPFG